MAKASKTGKAKKTKGAAPTASRRQLTIRKAKAGASITITEAGVEQIREWAQNGLSITAIAAALNISRRQFFEIRKRDPRIDEALERGHGALEHELTDILLKQARDGNTVAAIFLAKARCGWSDRGPNDDAGVLNVQINDFSGKTTPELRDRLAQLLADRERLLGGGDS